MSSLSELLIQIPGIGDKTVHKYKKLIPQSQWNDISSMKRLRSILIKLSPDKFSKLPIAAQADLLFQPTHNIPRSITTVVDNEFKKYVNSIRFDIAGSYRREKPQSSDLDIVISARGAEKRKTLQAFICKVNSRSNIVHIMEPHAGNDDKITVLFRIQLTNELKSDVYKLLEPYHNKARITKENAIYIKADIFLTRPDEYIFALLFATGSGKFNVRMRKLAKIRGYLLNQRGLYKKTTDKSGILQLVPIKNEREVFQLLNMRYLVPKDRIA